MTRMMSEARVSRSRSRPGKPGRERICEVCDEGSCLVFISEGLAGDHHQVLDDRAKRQRREEC